MWTRRVLRRCPVVAVMLAVTSCGAGAQMHDHPEPKRGVAQKQIVKRVDGVAFAVQPGLRRVCCASHGLWATPSLPDGASIRTASHTACSGLPVGDHRAWRVWCLREVLAWLDSRLQRA